jgi:hypothetical protein
MSEPLGKASRKKEAPNPFDPDRLKAELQTLQTVAPSRLEFRL